MNDHLGVARAHMERVRLMNVASTIQRNRHDGHPSLYGEIKRSALERLERPIPAAGSLGKQNYRHTAADTLSRLVKTPERFPRLTPIHGNVVGAVQVPAQERQVEQGTLGEKAELDGKVDKEDGNVHGALVVRAIDRRLVRHVFQTFNSYPYPAGFKDEPRPSARPQMLPAPARIEYGAGERQRPAHDGVKDNEIVGENEGAKIAKVISQPAT